MCGLRLTAGDKPRPTNIELYTSITLPVCLTIARLSTLPRGRPDLTSACSVRCRRLLGGAGWLNDNRGMRRFFIASESDPFSFLFC